MGLRKAIVIVLAITIMVLVFTSILNVIDVKHKETILEEIFKDSKVIYLEFDGNVMYIDTTYDEVSKLLSEKTLMFKHTRTTNNGIVIVYEVYKVEDITIVIRESIDVTSGTITSKAIFTSFYFFYF